MSGGLAKGLAAHLAGGLTTLCRCWAVRRRDGMVFGFTDHDRPLAFGGVGFRPETGLTAGALAQVTGLAVDNTEVAGALSDAAVTEADLLAGRFDGAAVEAWLVNWAAPGERVLRFRGTLGEVAHGGGAFRAELRGLTEALNRPQGRVYQRDCSAVLGDVRCGFDLSRPGYAAERVVAAVAERRVFRVAGLGGFEPRWFERGRLVLLDGAAAGLSGVVKNDRIAEDGLRVLELWQSLGPEVAPGDRVRVEAGCDRTAAMCRLRFDNFPNFRGFPHLPGEDWLVAGPAGGVHDGGSLGR